VLFNTAFRALPWCAASGAFALAVRTIALSRDWSLEAASFFAALALGFVAFVVPCPAGLSRAVLDVAGCIPLIPGALATKAILSLFAIATKPYGTEQDIVVTAITTSLHVLFTLGALGTGLAIPMLLLRVNANKQAAREGR